MNSARKDGLVLRHWKREGDAAPNVAALPVTPADSNAASEMDTDDRPAPNIEDSRAAKWNVKIDRPRYSVEEYDTHLKNDDWSKEETDYLVDLAIDYDLRWVVIIDRYDCQPPPKSSEPSEDAMAIDHPTPQPKPRTMEDLKARYYAIAAKCMALRTPLSSMNPTEFEEHEKMLKFDPNKETLRKQYVEKLFFRTPEEAHEEELLLKELSRIVLNQEKLFEDRKALHDRLEAPRSINQAAAHASTTVYQSSQGLQQLMQTMMQSQRLREAEKREKRRSALGVDTETANSQSAADLRTGGGRGSMGSASAGGGHDKRQPHPTPQHRPFSQAERVRFGISYPQERLTSGVQFRHERVVKASQAKSAVQTSRINDALAELGIPPRLLMPTNRVVTEYERLVEGVKQLVEIRKMREKVDGEIKIWEAQRRLANGDDADEGDDQTAGENAATNAQGEPSKDEEVDKEPKIKESEHGDDASKVESKEEDEEEEADEGTRNDAEEKVEEEDETEHLEDSRAEAEEDVKDEDEDEDGEASNASPVVEEEEDEEDDDDDDDEEEGEGEAEGEGEDEEQSEDDDEDQGENEDEDERAEVEKDGDAVNSSENQVDDSNEEGENEDAEAAGANEANEPDDGSATRARSMQKRSASVISAVSNKSTKRQKK